MQGENSPYDKIRHMSKKSANSKKKKTKKDYVSESSKGLSATGYLKSLTPNVLPENRYVKNTVLALVFFVLCLFFILAACGFGGTIGTSTYRWFHGLLGYGYYVLPFLLGIQAYFYGIHKESSSFAKTKIFFSLLLLASALGIFELSVATTGGILGQWIASPLMSMLDKTLSYVVLTALLLISLVVLFEYSFGMRKPSDETIIGDAEIQANKTPRKIRIDGVDLEDLQVKDIKISSQTLKDNTDDIKDSVKDMEKTLVNKAKTAALEEAATKEEEMLQVSRKSLLLGKPYVPPPLALLERDKGKPEVGDIKANANIIKRTLQNFGVQVEMDEISVGPSVTRYALKPAEGVKLSKILGLQNNLSLALAAHPIRIEAPIPGKSLVGIEVPNTTKTIVGLGTLLGSDEYQKSPDPLLVALGKGVSGKMYYENLAKMPHVLIAGTTGSGKSVMIHNLITSLLYKNSPENLRFIFIDPKRVELTLYNRIPHLLTPVITDPKKAILSLKWAGKEMSRRYDILEKYSVRDIDSYHKNILMPALEKAKRDANKKPDTVDEVSEMLPDSMPYIVIVIDELADIMQTYPRELESGIVRLAQMSRAVGIHLVLSTQRPSVNVITGLIKANIPSRFALQVASQIDSRTILDARGAEELLGKGDMLFMTGRMPNPQRVQSPNITEDETKSIVKHLINNMEYLPDTIALGNQEQESSGTNAIFSSSMGDMSDHDMEDEDDLYAEAKQAVIEAKKASTSYLQRKLRIGYSRAARLIDILESKGVIGPADGSKPRDILDAGNPTAQTSSTLESAADALLGEESDDNRDMVI
ncbi:MAG: cell division protein ftsK, segregation ATPase FtsK/SpoIIIE, family [Candidatus Parcubacteria bacterium]|jgi:S-DNA-T family DNA segregation ATPase FtsK/SpoIIIE